MMALGIFYGILGGVAIGAGLAIAWHYILKDLG
jgi:hypothetical protein